MKEFGMSYQNTEVASFQRPLKSFQTFVTGNRFCMLQVWIICILVKSDRLLVYPVL